MRAETFTASSLLRSMEERLQRPIRKSASWEKPLRLDSDMAQGGRNSKLR